MDPASSANENGIYARLSRFALCIATSSNHAYSALEAVSPLPIGAGEDALRTAFQCLLAELDQVADDTAKAMGSPPNSVVARFSFLPYHQRVAFALVVIEEFSISAAAEIMSLQEDDVRNLLLSTRDFLFASQWTNRADA